MKALILRDANLGDIIMSSSVIEHLLAAGYTQVDWLSNPKAEGIKRWLPACKNVFMLQKGKDITLQLPLLLRMRKQKYNLLIIFERSTRYYQLVWVLGAKMVATFLMHTLLKRKVDHIWKWNWDMSDVRNYNELIRLFMPGVRDGRPRLIVPHAPYSARMKQWIRALSRHTVHVTVHPGTSIPHLRGYPAMQYVKLLKLMLEKQEDIQVVLSGSRRELDPYRALVNSSEGRVVPFFADATTDELCGLVWWSDVFISTDTGPMHVAAALSKCQVALYGPTNVKHTGPCNSNALVVHAAYPCCPCIYHLDEPHRAQCLAAGHARCYETLTPESILGAMQKRWGDSRHIVLKKNFGAA